MKALGMVSSYSTIFRRIRLVIAWGNRRYQIIQD